MKLLHAIGACVVASALICGGAAAQQQPRIGGPAGVTGTLPPAQIVPVLPSSPAGITIAQEDCTGEVGTSTTGREGRACVLTPTMACFLQARGVQAAIRRCPGSQGAEGSTRLKLFEDLALVHEARQRTGPLTRR